MELRESFNVTSIHGSTSVIQLYEGDVTKLPTGEIYDNLVISAIPNDYKPHLRSVIGSLQNSLGISVAALSKNKEFNRSAGLHCWASHNIDRSYRRITVFEPPIGERTPENIKNVFQFLASSLWGNIENVACTLLGAGTQKASDVTTLAAILVNSVQYIYYGLPIRKFSLIIYKLSSDLRRKFESLKYEYEDLRNFVPEQLPFQIILDLDNNDKNYINIDVENAESRGCLIDCNSSELTTNFGVFRLLKPSREIVIYDRNNVLWSSKSYILCLLALIQQKASNEKITLLKGSSSPTNFPVQLFTDCYPRFEEKANNAAYLELLITSLNEQRFPEDNDDDDDADDDADIEDDPQAAARYVDHELKYLTDDFLVDIVILYDVNNADDFEKADILADALSDGTGYQVYRREVRRDGGSGRYTNLQEIKRMFTAIHRARVIIALVSQNFLDGYITRLEYTLAQCCHASVRYPCSMVSIALDNLTLSGNPGVKTVFTRDPIFRLISHDVQDNMFLSDEAIQFLRENGFHRAEENIVSSRFRPFTKSMVEKDAHDDNFVRSADCENANNSLQQLIIISATLDQDSANCLYTLIRNQMTSYGLLRENVNITLESAVSDDLQQKLDNLRSQDCVVYLLTNNFFNNPHNVDAIYNLFLRENNIAGMPFVRFVSKSPRYPKDVPMFIRRINTFYWRNNQESGRKLVRWILSDKINSSADVIMEPKSNFDRRNDISSDSVGDLWMSDAAYPDEDEDE